MQVAPTNIYYRKYFGGGGGVLQIKYNLTLIRAERKLRIKCVYAQFINDPEFCLRYNAIGPLCITRLFHLFSLPQTFDRDHGTSAIAGRHDRINIWR
jgi:hypothetical protein